MDPKTLEHEAQLIATIQRHEIAYYVDHTPTVSDADYDALVAQLKAVEKELGRALPHSPTQRVGSDLSAGFAKVKHTQPMLSLDNVFSPDEVCKFFSGQPGANVCVEAKIDGLSLELRYSGGLLTQAVTRGDGAVGDDVTLNARAVRGIPLSVDCDADFSVRGEVYMRRSVFDSLNKAQEEAGEDLFANPRNAASGSFKRRSAAEVAARQLSFVAYWTSLPFRYQSAVSTALAQLGFPTLAAMPLKAGGSAAVCHVASLDDVAAAVQQVEHLRASADFDMDGAVVKLDDRELQRELGNATKAPRWACAYKFKAEEAVTTLEDIVITVGRTGQVTPNARLKPVQLSGSTVSAASLMNQDELERIGNPSPGDDVVVVKSAEIIPRLLRVAVKKSRYDWKFPAACPFCQVALERRGVHWFDPNPACPERVYARLRYSLGKTCLDWDGMGESQVRALIAAGVNNLADLFIVDPTMLKTAARKKFLAERERVKSAPLWRKLAALAIENVGRSISKDLAQRYQSLENIVTAVASGETKAMLGEVAHKSLAAGLAELADEIMALDAAGYTFVDTAVVGPLSGKTFVITGTLMSGTREDVAARIEAKGGVVKSSVSKTTDYLVAGEQPGANKTSAAAKHGTKVLNEEALYTLMGEQMTVSTPINTDNI